MEKGITDQTHMADGPLRPVIRDTSYQKYDVEGGWERKNKERKITQILVFFCFVFFFFLAHHYFILPECLKTGKFDSQYTKVSSLDNELHRRTESTSGEASGQQPRICFFVLGHPLISHLVFSHSLLRLCSLYVLSMSSSHMTYVVLISQGDFAPNIDLTKGKHVL